MANTRSKIDGKAKQREIEKIFYDDTQEEKTTTATPSKRKISTTELRPNIKVEDDQEDFRTEAAESMHTFSETGAGVPAFLAKLWRLVDDPDTNHLICWNKDGRSFIIQNQAQFARELLPLNYKHNNMASFIRQLNMYGFHKITSIDNGGLKFDRDEMEFSHPCFKRNCSYLLEHIKRKIANTKSIDDKSGLKPEAVTKVLQDVKAMRGRQDSLDSRFSVMKQENEALWREIASLRQKHAKQQQIVNKLIQFLITIVQPSRNMTSVKRHMQLMIHDAPDNAKLRKESESESEGGPVIHELGEELLDDVVDPDMNLIDAASPYGILTQNNEAESNGSPQNIERPHSSISQVSQQYDYSNQSAEDAVYAAIAGVSGGVNLGEAANVISSPKNGIGSDSSIIKSVNPDGSHIFYHVTEVPDALDAQQSETTPNASPSYGEDNVLTTPMVRQQMARTQQLKQRNRRRRKLDDEEEKADVLPSTSAMASAGAKRRSPLQIKAEKGSSIGSMPFLSDFSEDNEMKNIDSQQSPPLKSNALASFGNGTSLLSSGTNRSSLGSGTQTTNFYNPNEFMTPEMPADIFEESPAIPAESDSYGQQIQQQQQQQQQQNQQQLQFGRKTANNGKFSSFVARNNSNDNSVVTTNGASTSAAAAAAAAGNQLANIEKQSNSTSSQVSSQQGKNNNGDNMSLTKYKSGDAGGTGNEEIMRMSIGDEVNDHLDNVQDELESLKDLLRSDGYSLDANTILGNGDATNTSNRISLSSQLDGEFLTKLFNDSDILGPYGLNLVNETNYDKKGSELMSYQPMYDLSDIIDINDKNELEAVNQASKPSSSKQLTQAEQQQKEPSSGLNTPYNDYFANALEPASTLKK